MLRCVANDMNRWEIFSSLLIGTSIYNYVSLLATQRRWEKMHFTWFSRRDGFSPTLHQIMPSLLRGSWQDTVSSSEKTPSLQENHVKCMSYLVSWHHQLREQCKCTTSQAIHLDFAHIFKLCSNHLSKTSQPLPDTNHIREECRCPILSLSCALNDPNNRLLHM